MGLRVRRIGLDWVSNDIQAAIKAVLESSGLAYEVMPCDPGLADTAVFCAHYGYALEDSANTIIVKAKTGERRYVACVLLANGRLDVNTTIRKRIGARRVSFASADETRELTGMEIGGVTPLALPPEIELWVDSQVMNRDTIILGGGDRSSKIRIGPAIFHHAPNTAVVDGLALI